jgi:phage virion morphogenesis protein
MGSMIEVNVKEIEQLAQKLNGYALTPSKAAGLLHSLGVTVAEQTKDRFDDQLDPEGRAWKPWTEAYHKYLIKKFPKATLLVREDNMRKITSEVNGSASVLVGSVMEYADYHQNAKMKNRLRRFLGLNNNNIADLSDLIDDFMKGKTGG